MNKWITYFLLLFLGAQAHATVFENKEVGVLFEYPENWKSEPVTELNKPISIFEACRNQDHAEFLTFTVFPTEDRDVDQSRLEAWTAELLSALNLTRDDLRTSKILRPSSGVWYEVVVSLNKKKVVVCSLITNGYCYTFSFSTKSFRDKAFDTEALSMVASVKFSSPACLQAVKGDLGKPVKDTLTGLMIPSNFKLTKWMERQTVAPYAFSLYRNLLSSDNADYVLVADNMDDQLFCFNVKLTYKLLNNPTENLLSKFVGNKFREDGIEYEEVSVGPWDKSPDKVFLHKFRLVKTDAAITHYIFYCNKNGKTDVLKFQTATVLESEFESGIFDLVLLNL